jgi:catechol 2,3-dioxygenase-like lactoylglutathione lyase family enzyme
MKPRLILLGILTCTRLWSAESTPRDFHVRALYHVGYWVRDIAKARAFYHDYLGFAEPYSLNYATGKLQMVVMKVNERQVIYLFTDATRILPNGDNLDHFGLEVDDLQAFRKYVLAHGAKVGEVNRGRIGDFLLGIRDPDGRTFEATQFAPEGQLLKHQGEALPATRVSNHLRSATIMVSDLAASLRFYQDVLCCEPIGQPGKDGAVRVRVADGTDFLVLKPMPSDPAARAATHAAPEYTLIVPNLAETGKALADRAATTGFAPPSTSTLSAFGEREISCIDPDGTRVVLVEQGSAR